MKWIIFLFVATGMIVGFFAVALPYMNEIQVRRTKMDYDDPGVKTDGIRYMQYKISAEKVCRDLISLEIYEKCSNSTNCDETCRTEGCAFFGSDYIGSDFRNNNCYCNCSENVYKKVLPPIKKK
jgi:hypothetical protein